MISKVYTNNIVSVHFRYQLQEVDEKCTLSLFMPVFNGQMFDVQGQNVNTILFAFIDIIAVQTDISTRQQRVCAVYSDLSGAFFES